MDQPKLTVPVTHSRSQTNLAKNMWTRHTYGETSTPISLQALILVTGMTEGKQKRAIPHIMRRMDEIRDTTQRPVDELRGNNSNDWLATACCGSHQKSHDMTRQYIGRHCPGILFHMNICCAMRIY